MFSHGSRRMVGYAFLLAVLLAPFSMISEARAATWWQPAQGQSWDIWLSKVPKPANVAGVKIIDLDLFETSRKRIRTFHQDDVKVICYFSAGSYENWRPDKSRFKESDLGKPLDGWPGERWLDVTSNNVRSVMEDRLDLAKSKGCDAVDPDNVDGYQNNNGVGLKAADQLSYNRFLANAAHKRGLAVGLKNDLGQVRVLEPSFDFAVNEQCFQYNECKKLQPFIDAGKPVFQIEYGRQKKANKICPKAEQLDFDSLVKRLNLGSFKIACS